MGERVNEINGQFYAVMKDGSYVSINGGLNDILRTEYMLDPLVIDHFFYDDELTITTTTNTWSDIWLRLIMSNNWRKMHGLPLKRRFRAR